MSLPPHPGRRRALAEHLPDLLFLAGGAALFRGTTELWGAAGAYLVLGLALVGLALRLAKPPAGPRGRRDPRPSP